MLHHVMSPRQEEGSQCNDDARQGVIDDAMEVFDMTRYDSRGEDTPQAPPLCHPPWLPRPGRFQLHCPNQLRVSITGAGGW